MSDFDVNPFVEAAGDNNPFNVITLLNSFFFLSPHVARGGGEGEGGGGRPGSFLAAARKLVGRGSGAGLAPDNSSVIRYWLTD